MRSLLASRQRSLGRHFFNGTRVPVQTLVDYLSGGHSLDEFLDDSPTVRREQPIELLQKIKEMLADAEE